MNKKQWRSLAALALGIVLVVTAGCQALGGLDFNEMLKNSMKITSMEGKQSLAFELVLKDNAGEEMDETDLMLLNMLSSIRLDLTEMKQQNEQELSAKGRLTVGEKGMDFALRMDAELLVVELEGARQPFRIDLTDPFLSGIEEEASVELEEAELQQMARDILDLTGGYMIDNLPNPSRLSVSPGQQTINGETVNVLHVASTIDGTEMVPLALGYLEALIADENGLRTMLEGLLEIFMEQEAIASYAETLDPFADAFSPELEREQAIEEAVGLVLETLTDLKSELETAQEEEAELLAEIFNDQTYVKLDLYVDAGLNIRKSVVEAVLTPQLVDEEEASGLPYEAIKMTMSSESWNVNGQVTAESPVAAESDMTMEKLFELESYEIVRLFSEGSLMHDMLVQMGMNKQTITMDPVYDWQPPFVTPSGVTMIPLRAAVDGLDATLYYNGQEKTYRVQDRLTDTELSFKLGGRSALVNGQQVSWAFPVTVISGTTYVPARDFMRALGGTVYWESYEWYNWETEDMDEFKYFVMEREL